MGLLHPLEVSGVKPFLVSSRHPLSRSTTALPALVAASQFPFLLQRISLQTCPPPFRSWEGDLHSAVFGEGHCVLRPQDLGRRVPHSTPGEGRQGQIRHLSSPAWPSRLVALQCTDYTSLGGRGGRLHVFGDSECLSYSRGLTRILLLCS